MGSCILGKAIATLEKRADHSALSLCWKVWGSGGNYRLPSVFTRTEFTDWKSFTIINLLMMNLYHNLSSEISEGSLGKESDSRIGFINCNITVQQASGDIIFLIEKGQFCPLQSQCNLGNCYWMPSHAWWCTKHNAELIRGQCDLRFEGVLAESVTLCGE